MRRTVPPSAEIEAQIDQLLAVGVGDNPRESLSELAKLGARLIIQRAVEDEFDAWLGRARYERRPEYQRGLRNYESGLRNGFRPRRVQTAEGELSVEIPQVREAAETFASKLFPQDPEAVADRAAEGARDRRVRPRPLDARRRVAVRAGRTWEAVEVDRLADLRGAQGRYEAFKRRSLYDIQLVALFLDATFISVRPSGPKEGVLVAWGFTEPASACCSR